MGPDEDDFDEREPLPDPTLRSWRHPSELGALAAMAARDQPGPPRRRRLAFGSLLLGGALGAVAVLAVLASAGLVGRDPVDSRLDLRDPATRPTVGEPSDETSTSTTAPGPTTTMPVTSTTTPAVVPPTTHGDLEGGLAVAELGPLPAGAVVGIAVHDDEVARPRSTGLVIDQVVVTSASALGTEDRVTLVVDGATYPATVVGRDRFTDVAVLDPDVDAPLHELPTAALADASGRAVAVVATDGRPEPITVVGRITAQDQVGVASDGHGLLGLLTTTARLPESGAGSPLLDPHGQLVGMVVDTPGHLASAVPEATLRAVAHSLRHVGHPVPVWLGAAVSQVGHDVVVDRVVPGGPAATGGLRAGDVLRSLDGAPVGDLTGFFGAIRARRAGDPLSITAERDGTTEVVDVVLADPPPTQPPTPDERAAD